LADVFIIGGGPAGSAAARLLASWGWSVVVAHRASRSPSSLAESLPASTRKLLAHVGLLDAVEAAAFHPNSGNISQWAETRHMTTTGVAGFHVLRSAFDAVLRRAAAAAGARIVDAVVRRVEIGEQSRVEYVTADGNAHALRSRYVLDCSGRAGVVARRGWRRTESAYGTTAVAAEWESGEWPPNEQTHTIVESYRDGWAWSVPLSATRRQFTVMIDHRRGGGGRAALSVLYATELAKTRELAPRLKQARQTSRAWACDASLYDAVRAADTGVLLVGDAASFIEPLSSAGVKKAVTSAWRAAVVVNTCLSKPDMTGSSLDYFSERERDVYAECRRRSAAFFRDAAAAHDDRFWSSRAEALSTTPSQTGAASTSGELLASDAGVRAAFDSLRSAEQVRLRPAATVRVAPVATIEGREIVERDGVILAGFERPLRFAAGVDLPALVGLTGECHDIPALISSYRSRVGPIPVEQLLTGVSLLVARRALVNDNGVGVVIPGSGARASS
jgi:flavin-dependent dehydrogenase